MGSLANGQLIKAHGNGTWPLQRTNFLNDLGRFPSQNWPAGPLPYQSFWQWNRIFPRVFFFMKTHLLCAYYSKFDWSDWIVLIKVRFSLRQEWSGQSVLTNGKRLETFSGPHWHLPRDRNRDYELQENVLRAVIEIHKKPSGHLFNFFKITCCHA